MFPVKEEQMKDKGRHGERRILPMNRVLMLLMLTLLFVGSAYAADLNYWIEPDSAGNPSKVWVKVPEIPADGTAKIYVRKEAGFSPNGESVFEFFDDFETVDTSIWGGNAACSVSGGILTVSNPSATWYQCGSIMRFTPPYVLMERVYADVDGDGISNRFEVGMDERANTLSLNGGVDQATVVVDSGQLGGKQYYAVYDGTVSAYHRNTALDVWREVSISVATDGTVTWCIDDAECVSSGTGTFSDDMGIVWWVYDNTVYVDWVAVRKYAEQDPTVTVTDLGDYYEVTIINNTSTDLTDFQVSIPASELGVTSTTESLHFSDQSFSGISVSVSYSPTDENALILDPYGGIPEINVTYTATVSKVNATVTSWAWTENNITIAQGTTDTNQEQITRTYTEPGTYEVCFEANGIDDQNNPVSDKSCVTVTIEERPQVLVWDYYEKIPFPGQKITFVAHVVDNGTFTFDWNVPGSTEQYGDIDNLELWDGTYITANGTYEENIQTLENVHIGDICVYSLKRTGATGSITVEFLDENGNVIDSNTYSVTNTVDAPYCVEVNKDLSPGNYTLRVTTNKASLRRVQPHTIEKYPFIFSSNTDTTALLMTFYSYDSNVIGVIYDQPGEYNVTLTVTDDAGLSRTVSHVVKVYPDPYITTELNNSTYHGEVTADQLSVESTVWHIEQSDGNIIDYSEADNTLDILADYVPKGTVVALLSDGNNQRPYEMNLPWVDYNYTITAGFHPTVAEENITFFWDFDNNVSCSWAAGATTGEFNGSPEGEYNATWEHKEGGSLSVWAKCTDDKNNSMYHKVTKGILVYKIEPMDEETGVYDLNLWGDVQTGEAPLFRFIATDAEFNESYIYEDINETMWLVLDPTKKWFMRFEQHYTDQVIIDAFDLEYSPYDIPLCVSPDKPNILQTAFSSTPIDGKAFAITRAETGCLRTIQTTGYVKDGYGFTFYTQAGQYAVWLIDGPGKYEDKQLLAAFFGDTQTVLDLEKLLLLLKKAEAIELPPYHTIRVEELPDENASVIKFISNEVMKVFEMNIYYDGADEPFYTQKVYDVNSLSTTILWKQYDLNRDTVVRITYRGELPDGRVIKGSIRTTMSGRLIKYAWWQTFIILFVLAVMAFLRIKNPTQFLVFAGLYIVFAVVLIPVTELTVATQAMGILGAILAIIAIIILTKFI